MLRPTTLTWTTFPNNYVAVGRVTQDGFDVRVIVDYDQYTDPRVEETDVDTGIRNPRFRWTGDPWDTRHTKRFLSLESETTVRELAPDYRTSGMSRHVAWETARVSLQKEADAYMEDDYCEYVMRAEASIDDIKLGESFSLGGIEVESYRTMERDFEDAAVENGLIEEAIAEARKSLAKLVAAAH
jgi:hypothetical protein